MTTLKCKSGGVQNSNGAGHPRSLIDESTYREHRNFVAVDTHWPAQFSGWSNASRPRDFAITLRHVRPLS